MRNSLSLDLVLLKSSGSLSLRSSSVRSGIGALLGILSFIALPFPDLSPYIDMLTYLRLVLLWYST